MVKCMGCQIDMEQTHPNNKKCNKCVKGKQKEYEKRHSSNHVIYRKLCENCGVKFYTKKITGKVCTNKCRNNINNKKRQIVGWENKIELLQLKIKNENECVKSKYEYQCLINLQLKRWKLRIRVLQRKLEENRKEVSGVYGGRCMDIGCSKDD